MVGLDRSVEFHRRPPEVREPQRRESREIGRKCGLGRVVAEYVAAYERLNGDVPLFEKAKFLHLQR